MTSEYENLKAQKRSIMLREKNRSEATLRRRILELEERCAKLERIVVLHEEIKHRLKKVICIFYVVMWVLYHSICEIEFEDDDEFY